jgi:acid stress-induced BolA-like protein IbaG/YrbA
VPLQIGAPPREIEPQIRAAVEQAIPGAVVKVSGNGNHFSISVTSSAFADKKPVERQRLVYAAIAHLMKGDGAPVHAIDRLETLLP